MRQKLLGYVDSVAKRLVKEGMPGLAKVLLNARHRFQFSVLAVGVKNISDVKTGSDVEFLWRDNEIVPVYDSKGNIVDRRDFACWLVRMRNCYVFSGTSFVLNSKKTTAYADLMDVNNSNYDYSYGAMQYHYKNSGILMAPKKRKIKIEKGIFLSGKASFNYYHLLTEILTRLYFAAKKDDVQNYPLLVDDVVKKVSQFKDALEILNVEKRPIIYLNANTIYEVEDLIIPSDGLKAPINVFDMRLYSAKHDFLLHPKAILYLRNIVLSSINNQSREWPSTLNKLFIGRRAFLARRPCNEDDLWVVAERKGFYKLYPEDYSFIEQAYIFNHCQHVLGNTGAALANIIFMKEGADIIYWVSQKNESWNFLTHLAKTVECSISYITGKQANGLDVHSYFEVTPQALEIKLSTLNLGAVN